MATQRAKEQFLEDMKEAGFDIREDYHGRSWYVGPAVVTDKDDWQEVARSTEVRLTFDRMGRDQFVFYPA